MGSVLRRVFLIAAVVGAIGPEATQAFQQTARSELRLRAGVAADAFTDHLAAPFRQTGVGFEGGLEYIRGGWSVGLTASSSGTSGDTEAGGVANVWSGSLKAMRLGDAGAFGPVDLKLGGGVGAVALVKEYLYRGPSSGTRGEFFADLFLPLTAAAGFDWRGGGGTVLEERLETSVVGVVFRSPFAGTKDFPPGRFTGFWDTQLLFHRLLVSHPISSSVALQAEHSVLLASAEEPRPLRVLQHGFSAGLSIRWGGGR